MTHATSQAIYRKNYTPPSYLIDSVALFFDLREEATIVRSRLAVRRGATNEPENNRPPLMLDGQRLELISVALNEKTLSPDAYVVTQDNLELPGALLSDAFSLDIVTRIKPHENLALEAL
ncbi:hypothetical protein CCP2SC5_530019 [Azospirillaceae bacterium]